MSNSDNSPRGGFLSRLFGRGNPPPSVPDSAPVHLAAPGEISMTPVGQPGGKRLARPKSVLVIATEDAATRRWRKEMENTGYGVEAISDGPKGLDILYGFSFDALLIDFQGPGIEGLNLLRDIRSHDELKPLFIVVMAADKDGSSEQEMAALDAGANRVFQRGDVKPDEILTALKTALFPRTLQAQPRAKQAPAPATPPKPPVMNAPVGIPMMEVAVPIAAKPPEPGTVSGPAAPPPRRTIRIPGDLSKATSLGAPAVNKKVLIIDADEAVAAIYRTQIEAAGYDVEVALDGETGFHDLYTINPDALLLDLLLPGGLSGSEILKKTRAQKKFEKIPILVFTNIYTRDVEEEAKAAGALRLFNKAAATPRDVIDSLNEIFLPSGAVFGGNGTAPIQRPTAKVDLPPLAIGVPPKKIVASSDNDFQKEIRESLLQGAPEFVKSLRGLLQVLLRSQGDAEAQGIQLLELYTRVHTLTANSAIAGFTKVARLAGALEAMLREFQAKPEGLNASTKRTLTQAVDFLAMLFTSAATHESGQPLNEQILVVDDEIISRRVIGHSLEKAGLKSTAVSHPDEAIKLLQDQPFDLVFLDVEMPGMNGFELCKRLRAMPLHAKTPVIFVTALSGFESRAKSSLSGGDDFIGKPFSYIELAVKGLIYVLRGAIGEEKAAPTRRMAVPVPDPLVLSTRS